jgi:hypothetical protein
MEDDLKYQNLSISATTFPNLKLNFKSTNQTLQMKVPFNGRRPLREDDLSWKMTYTGR